MSYHQMLLQVFDQNTILEDEIIGTIVLDLKTIVENFSTETGGFSWMEVYGAPTSKVIKEGVEIMNRDPATASK